MSVSPLAGKYENSNSKRCMKPRVHTSVVYNGQEPKCASIDEWQRRYDIYTYIHMHISMMKYYSAIKNYVILLLQQHAWT